MTYANAPDKEHDALSPSSSNDRERFGADDNRKYEVNQHIAAMLDIMGQTESLLRVGNPLDDGECSSNAEREKAWQKAAAPIWQLRNNFGSYLNHSLSAMPSPSLGTLLWQTFGDSIAVGIPVSEDETIIARARCLLIACGETIRAALDAHVPLQCAVELGLASTDLFPNELYGPLLAEVHCLLKRAEYPRAVVGDRLYRFLVEAANRRVNGAGERTEHWAQQAEGCLRLLDRGDGAHIVDYLGQDFAREVGCNRDDEDRNSVVAWFRAERTRYSKLGKNGIAAKYDKLTRYYLSRGTVV